MQGSSEILEVFQRKKSRDRVNKYHNGLFQKINDKKKRFL